MSLNIVSIKSSAIVSSRKVMNSFGNHTVRVLFTGGGIIVEQGSPEQIFGSPKSPRSQSFLTRFFKGRADNGANDRIAAGET